VRPCKHLRAEYSIGRHFCAECDAEVWPATGGGWTIYSPTGPVPPPPTPAVSGDALPFTRELDVLTVKATLSKQFVTINLDAMPHVEAVIVCQGGREIGRIAGTTSSGRADSSKEG
jgi:hypothetical protein